MMERTKGCRWIDAVSRQVGNFSAVVLALLVLLVVYDATVRYLFSSGSVALQELEWHLFDVIILLGIAYTLRENAHVRVDIFYDHYSEKRKALVDLLGTLLFILPFCALIVYVGSEFVLISFEQLERSSDPGGLPYRFLVKSLMPLAFVLLALQALSEIVRAYRVLRGNA
jgi:TRAP-type mannitol/chloroaromatic compound transport system permease small subunit